MKMLCKDCNKVLTTPGNSDCFEIALDILKQHYIFNKNALQQRNLELQQVKERNEQLDKALQLLQSNSQRQQLTPPCKRFKSSQQQQQRSDDSWLGGSNSDRVISDASLTDDDAIGISNLNVALNSEQLFDTSASSPARSDINITSSSEFVSSPRIKESPKRNKQHDDMRRLRDCLNKKLDRSKSEWQTKERNNAAEKSWATKFLKPSNNTNMTLEKNVDSNKTDKKLNLSLKKSKMKQSLIHFYKTSKDESSKRESDTGGEDIIEASPIVSTKNLKYARSWSHRSGQNYTSKDLTCNNNSVTSVALANVSMTKDDIDKTLDDIVFDFSPTKKTTDSNQNLNLTNDEIKTKELKFDNDISVDCITLPNENHLGITNNKSDSSSVMILTPNTEDIIFVDDSYNEEGDIDTMDLMADIMKKGSVDNLENLKKYESKSLHKQNKDLETFKKPETVINIKQEKVTQKLQDQEMKVPSPIKPSVSSTTLNKNKHLNPLLSTEALEEEKDDEDSMPKPFIIKQDPDCVGCKKKLSIKERFNIDCVECDKLISFLNERLSDEQIKQHLDKCKHHNADNIMRQNTPADFWNPFILSFQADDPRNEVLIDSRFKNKKN